MFGVAGESGSGKTMSMLALLGLLPDGAAVEGRVRFDGRDLLGLPAARRRELAGRDLAMVFQDPMTSLHPMLTIGRQLTEHVRLAPRLRPPRRRAPCARAAGAGAHPGRPEALCAPTRTSSPAGCASGSRSRSPSRAVRSC